MKEEKPELTPGPLNHPQPGDKCSNCGIEHPTTKWETEKEKIAKHSYRVDYWCTNCGSHEGIRIHYDGPVPVQIGPGRYELQ